MAIQEFETKACRVRTMTWPTHDRVGLALMPPRWDDRIEWFDTADNVIAELQEIIEAVRGADNERKTANT